MGSQKKRPGDNRPNPEPTARHNEHPNSTATDAPAFVQRAWKRWSLAIDEAHSLELKPWPLAESAAAGIWSEWHCGEDGDL